jgi:hypothetical protein
MALLVSDAKEGLAPYLPLVIPQVQNSLIDPIPDVRATAAKAFGTLARVLPEAVAQDVLPWLFTTLATGATQV